MLTGCASSAPPSVEPLQIPASLRQPCPDLAEPADGTAGALLKWGVATAKLYRECQDRHRRVVEAVNPGDASR